MGAVGQDSSGTFQPWNGDSQPPRNSSDGQEADQDHVGVFGQEENGERRTGILDVEAGDDFRLALGHVERRAIGFGHAGDEVDQEQREQRHEEPFEEAVVARLGIDDRGQVHAAGRDQHADQGEAHRDFVADHLRRGAQRAEDGVLRVRRPAAEDDAVHAHRGHRQQRKQAGIDVGQHHAVVERNHRPGRERRREREHRRQPVQERTGVGWARSVP